jgi:long-chain acyl-CoA synthetase
MSFKPKFQTLVEIYRDATSKFADRPLFGVKQGGEWKWSTYGDFKRDTDAARAALAGLGVKTGDRVAIIANNRPEWAIAAYATYGLGACYVPMYESQHDTEWRYIINDSNAKVVFAANAKIAKACAAFKSEIPGFDHLIVLDGKAEGATAWDEFLKQGKGKDVPLAEPKADDVAGFIYTSGTTGKPKGVKLTHKNLAYNVSAMHAIFPMTPDDRSLSFLPWAHSFGQTVELHGLFSMGASMGIAEAVDKIVDNLSEVQPTLLFSVPRIFNRIYDGLNKRMAEEGGLKKTLFEAGMSNAEYRKKLAESGSRSGWADFKHGILDKIVFSKVRARFGGRLKYAFSGGAAISKQVAEFIDNLGITVYEGYGLTETSPIATANYPGNRKIGSIGKPIPGVSIEIDKEVTNDPVNGEIIVKGHNVMLGYHNLPEENDQVFTKDGGFRTGDMGYIDEDGFVYITGRIKEQYKLENGKYVVPSPLEELLKLSPFVSNVMVYGDNKPFNVALIAPNVDALKKWASEHGVDGDLHALLKNAEVHKLYERELEEHSTDFKQFEKIRKFELIDSDFTTENGMLTPKLSLKRRVVMEKYGTAINALYA